MGVFQMPSLGADMEAGKLVEWLVKPGDAVHRGDIVAVVETQKGAIEVEIFEEGVVGSLDAELGTTLPVGAPMATILADGEAPPPAEAPVAEEPPPRPVEAAPIPAAPAPMSAGPAASPAARKLAVERGLDLSALAGSGPAGAITLRDVEGAAQPAPAKPAPADAMAEMRKAIAAAMQRSKREIPHFQLSQTVDVQKATDWLSARNATAAPTDRILLGALFMKAAALAAGKVREMNGHYGADGFAPAPQVNLGVAVALRGGGLIAPAIPEADTLPLPELMAAMKDLVARARAMRLRSSELTSGTITVSSLGEKGAEAMTGIIFPPQVALLAIGAPRLRPWIVTGGDGAPAQIEPRQVVTFTLSADHRVSDGRQANRFLAEVDALLQAPEAL
ncbi:dihydrolipoamide acetyltransferase family protein [Tropicimonas sediminicola]|uniref:Dihydrolipoamide acetyltransferase component of pyruvate dehydrogenase complex n=1 Tax=Tropicimonas sediminicola TaxID=1031541 RepID=A0A239D6D4_9RHOB|nr:dihydrolipoamide acetyltransferase family protein [Tropicimonas sediminicola]SNS28076.1 pyruvate dehydrogenase E2 component (dihydrolipoamide acetyltransferase) [Tropicimonas sediminicola]